MCLVVALTYSSKLHRVVDPQRVLIGYGRFLASCYPPVFPARLWSCSNEVNPIFITVRLDDLDGTTQTVFCKFKAGEIEREFELRDDGVEGDSIAGDNIWSLQTALLIDDGSTAKVEVWAIDGEVVSPILFELLPIKSEENSNLVSWLFSGGLPLLIVLVFISALIGIFYSSNRRKELAKDLEMIESWSTFDPRELDDEFNE